MGGDSIKCLWHSSIETIFSNINEDFNEKFKYFYLETSSPSSLVETSDSNSDETSSISEMISRLEKDFTS